jgi:6-phosphogluconolactonase
MPGSPHIRIAHDEEEWATAAADLIHKFAQEAVLRHGRFLIALSGGTTPQRLYNQLAAPPYIDRLDWSRTTFFFSDERCVPPDHPDSNFGLANRALFHPLRINPDRVYRMNGEEADPDSAARDYEQRLREACGSSTGTWPRLDLVLLGLGQDGHTASLFPGTTALHEHQRIVAVGHAPSGPPIRLTLTLGVINEASVVLFLVTGSNKAGIVRTVLEPSADADRRLPAALVKPERGRLIWLLDRPAAAGLTRLR